VSTEPAPTKSDVVRFPRTNLASSLISDAVPSPGAGLAAAVVRAAVVLAAVVLAAVVRPAAAGAACRDTDRPRVRSPNNCAHAPCAHSNDVAIARPIKTVFRVICAYPVEGNRCIVFSVYPAGHFAAKFSTI